MSGAKSASSSRLLGTWTTIKDRQNVDNQRFQWRTQDLSRSSNHGHHRYSTPNLAEDEKEETAVIVLEQRRKFKESLHKLKGQYDDLETNLAAGRKPPKLRTAGGQILQGTYPRASHRWLGVPPRFGSEVADEKYCGAAANQLSKWLSTDKVARLKSEKSFFDKPVRHYLKLDDSINVTKMTGSAFNFIHNPLEDLKEQQDKLAIRHSDLDESYSDYDESEEEEDGESEYSEEEDEEESDGLEDQIVPRQKSSLDEQLKVLDKKFNQFCKKRSSVVRRDMTARQKEVEEKWRSSQANRPATLRFRR